MRTANVLRSILVVLLNGVGYFLALKGLEQGRAHMEWGLAWVGLAVMTAGLLSLLMTPPFRVKVGRGAIGMAVAVVVFVGGMLPSWLEPPFPLALLILLSVGYAAMFFGLWVTGGPWWRRKPHPDEAEAERSAPGPAQS